MANTCAISGGGATGWLVTTAPIESPGSEIELLLTIWDSGSGDYDSTILIDNFRFETTDATVGTERAPQ